jgi:hypothetical protein
VSEDGSFIVPVKFAQTIKAGILLEISILQRQVQNWSDRIQTICAQVVAVHSQPQQETDGSSGASLVFVFYNNVVISI